MTLITFKTFDNSTEAHLVKTKLESEGIECYIHDENIIALNPLWNFTFNGIKLKIREDDLKEAEEIFNIVDSTPITDDNDEKINCPNCGSEDFISGFKSFKGIKGKLTAMVSFLLLIYPFYYKVLYKCNSCGEEFRG